MSGADRNGFTVTWQDRRFYDINPPRFDVEIKRYSCSAVGGPVRLEMVLSGAQRDLLEALTMLRYAVTVYNRRGVPVWWGYVKRVEVPDGDRRTLVSDLDALYNRVRVGYTLVGAGEETTGPAATTEWLEDNYSLTQFGRREMLYTIGGTTATVAGQYRTMVLNDSKYPAVAPTRTGSTGNATMICEGWWTTLEWLYADVPPIMALAYDGARNASLTLGTVSGNVEIVQVFQTGPQDINLQAIEVRGSKTGSPTDDIELAVYSLDANDDLDAQIGSVAISGATMAAGNVWIYGELSSPETLTANTDYAVVITRSGAASNTNYYNILYDSGAGYTHGWLQRSTDGSNYIDVVGDATFRLYDNALVANETQIYSMLNQFGQFFRSVKIEDASGMTSESYRNGDSDALEEVERLMAAGTGNELRYLSTVDQYRNVKVFEQEAETTTNLHYIDREDNVWKGQVMLDPTTCPVGFWAEDKDTPEILMPRLFNWRTKYFVDEMEYDAATGTLTPTPIGTIDLLDKITGAKYG